MRKRVPPMSRISRSFLAALLIALLLPAALILPGRAAEEDDCVYFFNTINSVCQSDMILVSSNGHWGLIDTSNRESPTIEETDGTEVPAEELLGLSNGEFFRNGKTVAKFMIDSLGVTHLDFILGTHAHSDHIGGVPEIAALEHNGVRLVDENTVYFCKPYRPVNEKNDVTWHNGAFALQAVRGMEEAGARIADVSDPLQAVETVALIPGLTEAEYFPGTGYDDTITFRMGDFSIRLYNLFTTPSELNENVNSIVAVLQKGEEIIVSLGDIDLDQRVEIRVAQAIYEDVGTVDLVKVAHHGAPRYSNSLETADLQQPRYAVCTGRSPAKSAYALYQYYCRKTYDTVFYSVSDTQRGICARVGEDRLDFFAMTGYGNNLRFDPAPVDDAPPRDGWAAMDKVMSFEDAEANVDWIYFENGEPRTGWLQQGKTWYYLDPDGRMANGFRTVDGKIYYFYPEAGEHSHGAMATGWQYIGGSEYYFYPSGAAAVGETEIDGASVLFDENGKRIG